MFFSRQFIVDFIFFKETFLKFTFKIQVPCLNPFFKFISDQMDGKIEFLFEKKIIDKSFTKKLSF